MTQTTNPIYARIATSIASNSRFGLTHDDATGITRRFENVNACTDLIETFRSFPEAVYSIVDILDAEDPNFELAELVDIDDLVVMEMMFERAAA
jgi:hypothetical protein